MLPWSRSHPLCTVTGSPRVLSSIEGVLKRFWQYPLWGLWRFKPLGATVESVNFPNDFDKKRMGGRHGRYR